MFDINEIIERFKAVTGIKKDKDLAVLLNTSPQSFSARKQQKRNEKMIYQLMELAAVRGVNLHWLVTGQESTEGRKVEMNYARRDWDQAFHNLFEYRSMLRPVIDNMYRALMLKESVRFESDIDHITEEDWQFLLQTALDGLARALSFAGESLRASEASDADIETKLKD